MAKIRFADSLKVGAYAVAGASGTNIEILNNGNNYIITATGDPNIIQGESELRFDSINLAIGGAPSGEARLEIYHTGSVDNLILIRNTDTNAGIKVDNQGLFQLLEFSTLPTAITGGIVYSNNEFFVGIEE